MALNSVTDDEVAELWIAAASAAGVDISRELLEKEVVNRVCPESDSAHRRQRSGEVVEKWVRPTVHPTAGKFSDRCRIELLLCTYLGSARQKHTFVESIWTAETLSHRVP